MSHSPARPLDGIRVVDFTWSVAGPTMTRILAAMGADVIKIEWPTHPDPMRTAMFMKDEPRKTLNNGPFFANLNVGKRSLTINTRDQDGLDVVRELVRTSDVVAESFSASVLQKWGLGYDELKRLNHSIIYVSVSGFGHTGPHKNKNTWGPTAQAMSGTTFMSGLPDAAPAGWGWSYLDTTSGYMAATGVLAALVRRRRTGEGARLDMSQVEVGTSMTGTAVLDATTNQRPLRHRADFPGGNRSVGTDGSVVGYRGDRAAPSNAFRTGNGRNDYCAISVTTDKQWRSLVEAMGTPEWATARTLTTADGRAEAQEAIEEKIATWVWGRDKYELMRDLQSRGIPAGAVQDAEDRVEHDPQLSHLGTFVPLSHPALGEQRFEGLPVRSSTTSYALEERWPTLGNATAAILREVLGYDEAQIEDLRSKHVIWPEGMPAETVIERSLW